jgi:hypothetical protein
MYCRFTSFGVDLNPIAINNGPAVAMARDNMDASLKTVAAAWWKGYCHGATATSAICMRKAAGVDVYTLQCFACH